MSGAERNPIWLRAALAFGFGFWGLAIGTWLGGRYLVAPGQGLAGPAEALGYGLIAGLAAAVVAFLLAGFMSRGMLKLAAAITLGGAVAGAGLFYYRVQENAEARRDPESAYAGVPAFTASVRQIIVSDPYLRVEIAVDAGERTWTSTGPAPEHQTCRGVIRAQMLQDVAAALDALIAAAPAELEACAEAGAERRIDYAMEGASAVESLAVSRACADASPEVASMLRAMDRAALSPTSRVRCE